MGNERAASADSMRRALCTVVEKPGLILSVASTPQQFCPFFAYLNVVAAACHLQTYLLSLLLRVAPTPRQAAASRQTALGYLGQWLPLGHMSILVLSGIPL